MRKNGIGADGVDLPHDLVARGCNRLLLHARHPRDLLVSADAHPHRPLLLWTETLDPTLRARLVAGWMTAH